MQTFVLAEGLTNELFGIIRWRKQFGSFFGLVYYLSVHMTQIFVIQGFPIPDTLYLHAQCKLCTTLWDLVP